MCKGLEETSHRASTAEKRFNSPPLAMLYEKQLILLGWIQLALNLTGKGPRRGVACLIGQDAEYDTQVKMQRRQPASTPLRLNVKNKLSKKAYATEVVGFRQSHAFRSSERECISLLMLPLSYLVSVS